MWHKKVLSETVQQVCMDCVEIFSHHISISVCPKVQRALPMRGEENVRVGRSHRKTLRAKRWGRVSWNATIQMARGFHSCEYTSAVDISRWSFPLCIMDRGRCLSGSISSQGPKDCQGLLKQGDFIFSNGEVAGRLGEKKLFSEKGNRIAESNRRNIITKYFVYVWNYLKLIKITNWMDICLADWAHLLKICLSLSSNFIWASTAVTSYQYLYWWHSCHCDRMPRPRHLREGRV